jgi:(1->4)-alpha-D-glucan 1-alpha-D-glucosylmutase
LPVRGAKQQHAIAFMRGSKLVTIVPRLSLQLQNDWADTTLLLPEGEWRNPLTEEVFHGPVIHLKQLLAKFPVALLVCRKPAS